MRNKSHSNKVGCTVNGCHGYDHKMTVVYVSCVCNQLCSINFRIKSCSEIGSIELFKDNNSKQTCYNLENNIVIDREKRGIAPEVKTKLEALFTLNCDLTAAVARKKLICDRKESEIQGEAVFNEALIPSIKKVTSLS